MCWFKILTSHALPLLLARSAASFTFRLKALAQRKRVRKKEREAAARLRSRVAMGMENTAVDLPIEEGIFSLASIKVNLIFFLSLCVSSRCVQALNPELQGVRRAFVLSCL